jgi:class 3 adenylate cyclase
MDYTAQGQTVGLAARMEQLAAPGSVYRRRRCGESPEGAE